MLNKMLKVITPQHEIHDRMMRLDQMMEIHEIQQRDQTIHDDLISILQRQHQCVETLM